jgi:hypothetical protein
MSGQRLGSVIGAVFGLIYVLVNVGPLPRGAAIPLQILGVIACVGVLIAVARSSDHGDSTPRAGFGRAYWIVVAAEAAAMAGGLALLNGPLDAGWAGVAWVSVVVGLHFVALSVVFAEPFFNRLGAAVAVCGLVGLGLAVAGAGRASVAVVSGVVPGALLLASGWWGARQATRPRPA